MCRVEMCIRVGGIALVTGHPAHLGRHGGPVVVALSCFEVFMRGNLLCAIDRSAVLWLFATWRFGRRVLNGLRRLFCSVRIGRKENPNSSNRSSCQ